ncbi:transposase [Novipirellula sp.]|uniref:transposase n=1 Tax=Novipirellula sp. TaxID=2795430 RepID=UPI003564C753
MGRPKRADEAGGIYHALNRGNARADIFHKPEDYDAFERILADGLSLYPCQILAYQLMPNHWHFVLSPTQDGGMSNFLRWVSLTHTMRLHAHYGSAGEGHIYQGRFKSFPMQDDEHFFTVCRYVERNALRANLVDRAEDWKWGSLARWLAKPEPEPKLLSPWPIARLPNWSQRVNEPLTEDELKAIRWSVRRGSPYGDETWVESIARRLDLESTLRPRGRPRKKQPAKQKAEKES